MESTYKDALRKLRSPEKTLFKGFSVDWSYKRFDVPSAQTLPQVQVVNSKDHEQLYDQAEIQTSKIKESEKEQVIESFTQFTHEKLQQSPVISFKGGQVTESNQMEHTGYLANSAKDFLARQPSLLTTEIVEARFGKKNLDSFRPKVLFVSDSFIEHPDIVENEDLKELVCFFDEAVAGLFSRMIMAMGLTADDYVICALHPQKDEENILKENLINEILYFKPQYIVTLGAKAVSELLGTHKRLKNIHGQFFNLNFTDQNGKITETTLMPLFSPKLLHIASNMKQTAWKDMQKLMEKL